MDFPIEASKDLRSGGHGMEMDIAKVAAMLGAVLNSILLFLMCSTKSLRSNSVNCFTFAIVLTDLMYALWMVAFIVLVNSKPMFVVQLKAASNL